MAAGCISGWWEVGGLLGSFFSSAAAEQEAFWQVEEVSLRSSCRFSNWSRANRWNWRTGLFMPSANFCSLFCLACSGVDGPGLDGPGLDGPGVEASGLDSPQVEAFACVRWSTCVAYLRGVFGAEA
ncbi:MAG: hypothetical protein AAF597_20770 [Bacteroidota bacterium]